MGLWGGAKNRAATLYSFKNRGNIWYVRTLRYIQLYIAPVSIRLYSNSIQLYVFRRHDSATAVCTVIADIEWR